MHAGCERGRLAAAALAVAGLLVAGCGTTPGRDKPLEAIFEAVASPDGRLIAASTIYDEVALFDRAPLRFAAMLSRETDRHEWRAKDPQKRPFPHFSSPLLAFTPDGTTLVAAGIAGRLVAWDLTSRTEKYRVEVGDGVLAMAVTPNGLEIVTAGPDTVVWSAKNGSRTGQLTLPAGTQAMSVAVSPDGRVALVGLSDGRIAVFEVASRQLLRTLPGHSMPVYGVAFSPDGSMFASTAGQYDPRVWKADPMGEFTTGERAAAPAAAGEGCCSGANAGKEHLATTVPLRRTCVRSQWVVRLRVPRQWRFAPGVGADRNQLATTRSSSHTGRPR